MPSNWSTFSGNFWGYGDPLPTYAGDNIAIFMGGTNIYPSSLNYTTIYSYSTDIALFGATLSANLSNGSAVSNDVNAIYCNGRTDTNISNETDIYTYSNNIVTSGSVLTYDSDYGAATGNNVMGIFAGGNTDSNLSTSIYNYSNNTTMAGSSIGYFVSGAAAVGNSTIGMFCGGLINGYQSAASSLYLYSNNSFMSSNSMMYPSYYASGAGTPYVGVIGGGASNDIAVSTTSIFTYSTLVASNGGNLTAVCNLEGAASNSTVGVFGLGGLTSLYNYSSNSSVMGGRLSYSAWDVVAAGPNPGVNAGTMVNTSPAPANVMFVSSTTYVIPNGVYSITITLYAGGGGAGGSFQGDYIYAGSNGTPGENTSMVINGTDYTVYGGAGGQCNFQPTDGLAGGAQEWTVPVIPGDIVSITVGNGGAGGYCYFFPTGEGAGGVNNGPGGTGDSSYGWIDYGGAQAFFGGAPAQGGKAFPYSDVNQGPEGAGGGGGGGLAVISYN